MPLIPPNPGLWHCPFSPLDFGSKSQYQRLRARERNANSCELLCRQTLSMPFVFSKCCLQKSKVCGPGATIRKFQAGANKTFDQHQLATPSKGCVSLLSHYQLVGNCTEMRPGLVASVLVYRDENLWRWTAGGGILSRYCASTTFPLKSHS